MKFLKWFFGILFILLITLFGGSYLFWNSKKPTYEGELQLDGLNESVEVYYDSRGVPNIYAQNEADMYQALGYLHAQDRLFQFEMILRAASGTLSELFGPKALPLDQKFRALDFETHAEETIKHFQKENHPAMDAIQNYVNGVNQFIEEGNTPIEFDLMGIPTRTFTLKDIIVAGDYLSFGFVFAIKEDPLMSRMFSQLDSAHLNDLVLGFEPGLRQTIAHYPELSDSHTSSISNPRSALSKSETVFQYNSKTKSHPEKLSIQKGIADDIERELGELGIPLWLGSNGWAASPNKTKSGKVLFANDTHIRFSQPAVWYEASVHYPGFDYTGYFIALNPFGPIGYTPRHSWGFTMLLNDDFDFYREEINVDSTKVKYKGEWVDLEIKEETFKIKDQEDKKVKILKTPHGPIMNEFLTGVKESKSPLSIAWTYLYEPNQMAVLPYEMSRAKDIKSFESIISRSTGPGFNCLYGDQEGNIAWWSMAKLVKRHQSSNSKAILDGASGKDEYQGYYPFSENPKSINPPEGFIYTANNYPDTLKSGTVYPGYYYDGYRSARIYNTLLNNNQLEAKDFQALQNDEMNLYAKRILKNLKPYLENLKTQNKDQENILEIISALNNWDGNYTADSSSPIYYEVFIRTLMKEIYEDELGEDLFKNLATTRILYASNGKFFENPEIIWWDNKETTEKESIQDILNLAFQKTSEKLNTLYGSSMQNLTWGKVHTLEHPHPLSQAPGEVGQQFRKIFNVGPFQMGSGAYSVNKLGYTMNEEGLFKITSGPSQRVIRDFADPFAYKVLPTGQSGNVTSEFYQSQAKQYATGQYNKEFIAKEDVVKNAKYHLILKK